MRIIYQDTILYEFQKELVDGAKINYLYAADTGTGKTIMSIHHYLKHFKGEPLLIVAPPAKIKEGGWARDIAFIERTYGIAIKFEVLSYSKLSSLWMKYRNYAVIFDEAHFVKNPTSQRGKGALSLTRIASMFVLLTATPMPNGWEDAYNYFIMFGYYRNKTEMMKRHAITKRQRFNKRSFDKIVGWSDESVLKHCYKSIAVSISKDDALDLPPLVIQKVYFTKSKEYETIETDKVLNDVAFDSPAKLASGLRYYANRDDKLDQLKVILDGTTDNIIIFYHFQKQLEDIKKLCKGKKLFEVNGQNFSLPQAKPKNSVTLVQYQAGSSGIELQYANIVIFYSPTYSFGDYTQALGRAYRDGQKKKVTVFQFETKGTIEEKIWQALDNKKDFSFSRFLDTRKGVVTC